jgi:hypothetical protein
MYMSLFWLINDKISFIRNKNKLPSAHAIITNERQMGTRTGIGDCLQSCRPVMGQGFGFPVNNIQTSYFNLKT